MVRACLPPTARLDACEIGTAEIGEPHTRDPIPDGLRRLADALEILSLVARLADVSGPGDLDEDIVLFSEDASSEVGRQRTPGAPPKRR